MEWDKVRETDSDTSYSRQTDREKDTRDTTNRQTCTHGGPDRREKGIISYLWVAVSQIPDGHFVVQGFRVTP